MPTIRPYLILLVSTALLCLNSASLIQAQPSRPREFPVGSLAALNELPASRFRTELEAMSPGSKDRALQWLRSFHFTEADLPALHADPAGGIFYICESTQNLTNSSSEVPVVSAITVPISPFPSSLLFHSKPGAPNTLYINFSGMTVINTEWNTVLGRAEIPAMPFSTDTDPTTFSDAEQVAIKRIWQRMAEDYAPFDIDVTTEPPATLTTHTAVALITRTTDANGAPNPYNTAGGVAYVNVFGVSSYASYRPAWIYYDNLASDESFIAEAASHEIGHNMGLSHDGRTDGYEYYGGHGTGDISWGPLMGTGYTRNVSHWSKGEYYLANNTQDDLATISGKIPYRTDDHGDTTGTATALRITGGTNVVSTNPENDPANTNTANKGVLGRNTDLDVFSFITGSGPIKLAVNPWIMPSGTRGGNVDLLLELYNEAGVLLLTNNPQTQTISLIETNLMEGRYFLQVRNSGAGDPFISTPSGYTSYGSVGQYFISGFVTEAPNFVIPPTAELKVSDLTQSGQSSIQVSVTFSDNVAVDISTIDLNDLRVTGPNGYDRLAQGVTLDATTDGTPRTASYSFASASGSAWSVADNGTYTVWMRTNQVADTEGAWVAAGQLGTFEIAVPVSIYSANMDSDPGWTLEPEWAHGVPAYSSVGPVSGFTGTKIIAYNLSGSYANNLTAKYAITPPINCTGASSLTLRFQRWLRTKQNDTVAIEASTNGSTWVGIWSSSGAISDTSWQEVQYILPADFSGVPSVRLRWSLASNISQNDIGWNLDDVELLSNDTVDTNPPLATVIVTDVTAGGSPSHSCHVSYTDETAVRLSTLDSADIAVIGPNGYSNLVEFIAADLPTDGSPITATYSIAAPGGLWDALDNGIYTLTLLEGAVQDTLSNSNAQTILGTFSVSINTPTDGVLALTPASGMTASGTVGGPFSPGSIVYALTNAGGSALNWSASNSQSWLSLSAVSGSLAAGATTNITVSINAEANNLAAGSYSDSVSFVNTITGNGDTSRAVNLTVNSLGLLAISPAGELNASGTVGGPFSPGSMVYTLTNSGGSALNWSVSNSQSWLSLSAMSGTLAAGATTNITVSINAEANNLAAGTYSDSVAFVNTSTGSGDSIRAVNLTVNSLGLLAVSPAGELNASGTVGGPFSPGSMVYTLTNSGGSALNWSVSNSQSWLSLSAISGSLAAGATTNITVSINAEANNLAAGTYSDPVSFVNTSTGSGDTSRAVNLTVNSLGLLAVSPAGELNASGTVGGPFSPGSMVYTLTNSGGSALNWSVSNSQSWLSLSAMSGTLAAGATTNITVSINAEANNLAAGSYSDSVSFVNTITGNGDTSRAVNLTVNSLGLLAISPAGELNASGTVGGPFSPGSIVYALTNSGGSALNWSASKDQSWLSLSAISGSLAAGAVTNITVSINAEANNLAAGTYSDSVAFVNTSTGIAEVAERSVALQVDALPIRISLIPVGTLEVQLFFTGQPGMSYTLEKSPDLTTWTVAADLVAGSDGTVVYRDAVSEMSPNCFYRVKIQN